MLKPETIRNFPRLAAIGLLGLAGLQAQAVRQDTLTLVAPAPASVTQVSTSVTGARGGVRYNYWVIANYAGGSAQPAPAIEANGPTALSGSNFVTIQWTPVTGATSYDVLRTNTESFPSGPCTCAVATAAAGPSTTDTGAGLTLYTWTPKPPATGTIRIDNSGATPAFVTNPTISGGAGSVGANVSVPNSATPTFTCPSSTLGTLVRFYMASALSTSITTSTLTGCTGSSLLASKLTFVFTQPSDISGAGPCAGPCTVAMPTGFSQACQISPASSATTTMVFDWDGTTAWRNSCTTTGPGFCVETSLPGTAPPAAYELTGCDSAGPFWLNSAGAVLRPIHTRTVCLVVGADNGSALADADLGPQHRQYVVDTAMTLLQVAVSADAGAPNVIVGRSHGGAITNVTSAALATAAAGAEACSNTGGTIGINGSTTCSATLQNTAFAAGDWVTLVSGTAGGVAKEMTICPTWRF